MFWGFPDPRSVTLHKSSASVFLVSTYCYFNKDDSVTMLRLRLISSFFPLSACFWSNCLVNWGLHLIFSPYMTCTILSLLSHLSVMPKSKVRLQGLHSVAVAASTNKLTVTTCCSLKRFSELPLRLEAEQAGCVWIKSRNQDLNMTFQMPNSWAPRLAKSVLCRNIWQVVCQTRLIPNSPDFTPISSFTAYLRKSGGRLVSPWQS